MKKKYEIKNRNLSMLKGNQATSQKKSEGKSQPLAIFFFFSYLCFIQFSLEYRFMRVGMGRTPL